MVTQMNRLEHAARVAMGDDGFAGILHDDRSAPLLPGLSLSGRIALAIAGLAFLAIVSAQLL